MIAACLTRSFGLCEVIRVLSYLTYALNSDELHTTELVYSCYKRGNKHDFVEAPHDS